MRDRTDTTIRTLPGGEGGAESRDPKLLGLLSEIREFATDYSVFPSVYAPSVLALWIAHTWVVERFDSTPRLAILSAEKGSGKTRVLEILEVLVREPVRASDVSAPTLFRIIEKRRPTLLLDESDILLGVANDGADSVRSVVNAGYRKNNPVIRCVGNSFEPTPFDTFGPVALAGLGDLPETILDRSVILRIRRRARSEPVSRWRSSEAEPRGHALRDRLEEWSRADWTPVYPEDDGTISDRLADVWEPLFVVADRAGAKWPRLVREAVRDLTETTEVESLPLRLLREIRAEWPEGRDWWRTTDLLLSLQSLTEAPWGPGGPFGERGLTPHRLSRILHAYRISSEHNRDRSARGYLRHSFLDAWDRYLVPLSPAETVRNVGTVQAVAEEVS